MPASSGGLARLRELLRPVGIGEIHLARGDGAKTLVERRHRHRPRGDLVVSHASRTTPGITAGGTRAQSLGRWGREHFAVPNLARDPLPRQLSVKSEPPRDTPRNYRTNTCACPSPASSVSVFALYVPVYAVALLTCDTKVTVVPERVHVPPSLKASVLRLPVGGLLKVFRFRPSAIAADGEHVTGERDRGRPAWMAYGSGEPPMLCSV